jgi:hypothetical protein
VTSPVAWMRRLSPYTQVNLSRIMGSVFLLSFNSVHPYYKP